MSANAIRGVFSGLTAEFQERVATKTIHWKQESVVGVGGDRSQTYHECYYTINDAKLVVFVQSDMDVPKPRIKLGDKLQYGLNKGNVFFVLHDKNQTPYQHRFEMTLVQTGLWYANEALKKLAGYDVSWIAGDYLHNL